MSVRKRKVSISPKYMLAFSLGFFQVALVEPQLLFLNSNFQLHLGARGQGTWGGMEEMRSSWSENFLWCDKAIVPLN